MPPLPQARYRWVPYAFSPRDGGWVRLLFAGRTETEGWTFVEVFWSMMVLGDYETIDVKRLIYFNPQPRLGAPIGEIQIVG